MALSQQLTTQQRMVLTPQLRQRIEMLQMTTIELGDLVQQEMEVNPILEEVQSHDEVRELSESIIDHHTGNDAGEAFSETFAEAEFLRSETPEMSNGNGNLENSNGNNLESAPTGDAVSDAGEAATDYNEDSRSDPFEEIDFGREFQEYLDPGYRTQEIEYKEDAPDFSQFLSKTETLTEHLEWQLRLQPIDDMLLEAALCIVGNIDGDGRLNATNEEIGEMCAADAEQVEAARQIVMQLEPTGCGARDVRECLLAQLEAKDSLDRLAATMIADYLPELQPHKLPNLAKHLGVDGDELRTELDFIRTFDPYPGRRYASEEPVYIAPEIYIERFEGDYIIYFADDGSPRLRISSTYQQMLDSGTASKETRDFVKEKMRSAIDLLRNIEHRRQTIYRVVECIVERQQEFLTKGVQFLRPMMLKDVAEETGMHLSTISRVVNRKYAHTPQGVIELRRFFSEGMLNEDGEEVSTRIIKLRIKKIVEDENPREPITDDAIVKILVKEGIKLSRRTVAKYRDQMQIPGSRERKVLI